MKPPLVFAHSTDLDIMSLDWRPQRPRAAIVADMTLRNRGHHHSRIIASRRHCPRCSWSTDSVRRQKKNIIIGCKELLPPINISLYLSFLLSSVLFLTFFFFSDTIDYGKLIEVILAVSVTAFILRGLCTTVRFMTDLHCVPKMSTFLFFK